MFKTGCGNCDGVWLSPALKRLTAVSSHCLRGLRAAIPAGGIESDGPASTGCNSTGKLTKALWTEGPDWKHQLEERLAHQSISALKIRRNIQPDFSKKQFSALRLVTTSMVNVVDSWANLHVFVSCVWLEE